MCVIDVSAEKKGESGKEEKSEKINVIILLFRMEKFLNDVKNKLIVSLPAPKDFITLSRYVRKKSMVAGWLYVAMFIMAIICATGTWSKQNTTKYVDMGPRGRIETHTVGEYSLTHYHLVITTTINNSSATAVEEGSLSMLPESKNLWPCSQYVLAILIIYAILCVAQWYITLCHSWVKFDERRTYLITSMTSLSFTLMLVTCFVAYLGCKPKLIDGCVLSWAGWMFFILTIGQAVLMAVHFMDKPKGLIRYGEGGVLIFETIEGDDEASEGDGKASRRASTRKSGLNYNLLSEDSEDSSAKKSQKKGKVSDNNTGYVPPRQLPQPAPSSSSSSSSGNPNETRRKVPPPPLPKRNTPAKKTVKALYDCVGDSSSDELSFRRGDALTFVSSDPGSGWITCELNGIKGIVPENYVEKQ